MRAAVLLVLAVVLPGAAVAGERVEAPLVLVALAAATPPDPVPFRTQMLLTDRVKTGDRLFARLLLGGRVMILARERSSLRITEVPGATTIDVDSGRVAVTVDRENLRPEDLVEVRTPHAVAGVRGDTLIVEVRGAASSFAAFGAPVEVFRLDPGRGTALEPPTWVAGDGIVTVGPSATPTDVASR